MAVDVQQRFDERIDTEILRYGRVWEDESLLCKALRLSDADDVVSIASAGDNVFAMLAEGPRSVTAVDVSPAQLALVNLHQVCIDRFDTIEHAVVVGVLEDGTNGHSRSELYSRVVDQLDVGSRGWMDRHETAVAAGLVRHGKLERYISDFFSDLEALPEFLLTETPSETSDAIVEWIGEDLRRQQFLDHFGATSMQQHGRDPEQLRYVSQDVGTTLLRRFETGSSKVAGCHNPYLWRFVTGSDGPTTTPLTMFDPHKRELLRSHLDRLVLVQGDLFDVLQDRPPDTFSAANLSDVFEYHDAPTCRRLFSFLIEQLRDGARWVWWNLFVPRTIESTVPGRRLVKVVRVTENLSDRVFFYDSAFVGEFLRENEQ